jgi:DNA-binding transcriptional LysR family regulator
MRCATCAISDAGGCSSAATKHPVHAVLPLISRFRDTHPLVHVDVRRIPARQIGAEVAQGSLDFGVLTFQPAEPRLGSIVSDRTSS